MERATPAQLDLHLVLDNASTHKSPIIQRWLLSRPHVHLHSPPPRLPGSTSSGANSRFSPPARSSAGASAPPVRWRTRCGHTSQRTTLRPNHSCGPRQRTRSCNLLRNFACVLLTHTTSPLKITPRAIQEKIRRGRVVVSYIYIEGPRVTKPKRASAFRRLPLPNLSIR